MDKKEMKKKEFIIGCIINAILFKCSSTCTVVNTCMSWDTENDNLLLTCKVSKSEFNIEIIKESHIYSVCSNKECSPRASFTYDNSSHVDVTTMVLTLNANKIYNGRWVCKHGSGCGEASVDVGITQDTSTPTIKPYITGILKEYCLQLSLFAVMAGFVVTFKIVIFVVLVLKCCCKKDIKSCLSDLLIASGIAGIPLFLAIGILAAILLKKNWDDCQDRYALLTLLGIGFAVTSMLGLVCFKKCCRQKPPADK